MNKLLDLPFDQYQRYRDIQQIVGVLRGGKALKILDVGGYPGTIDDFLPNEDTTILDVPPLKDKANYVQGDGTNLPFDEKAFDLVVSVDTLEHVKPDERKNFLNQLARASKDYIILVAPFHNETTRLAEEIAYEFYVKTHRTDFEVLREHLDNGLPDLQETLKFFENRKYSVETVPSGYLYNWLPMQIAKIYVLSLPDGDELYRKIDRFYNMNFYETDHRQPSYRTVIVVSKKRNDLKKVKQAFDSLKGPQEKTFFGDFNLLMSLLNLKHQAQVQGMAKEIKSIHKLLKDKDTHISNLEAIIRGKEEHIRNLEAWAAKIQQSVPYKVYGKVKKLKGKQ